MPQITVVQYVDRYGNRLSLETECLRSHTLLSIAYGHKRCSQKHKIAPQEKVLQPLCALPRSMAARRETTMANTKLDRIERDIEKTRAKILEYQKEAERP